MATLVATYTVGSAGLDIGGLAANPATGKFYGTNDTATPVGRGLVELDLSGNATLIAPYPDGQTDIDGLAFGYDRAYLVTDEPGFIYVYDFAVMTYTAPITNPWTTSETFSAGAWIPPPGNPSIALTKTVGLDPNACGTTDSLSVEGPADVTYCYTVINTGDISFTTHYLIDSQLGNIFDGYPAELNPGATLFVTRTALVTQTTVNTATWTARDPIGAPGTASATATVAVTPTFVVYMPYLSSPPSSSAAPARIPVAVRLPPWLSIGLLVLLPAARRRSE
jgi:hypothetical protein